MNKYYVYCLLDPRKPGKFSYKKLNICFLYEPFYIGKGSGDRIKQHYYPSNLKLKNYKSNKIKSIIKNNKVPIDIILYENISEKKSLELEIKLIKNIGRSDNKTGVLCNLTDGGDGAQNLIIEKTRKKVAKINIKTKKIIKIYNSITEASEKNNLQISNISSCCNKKSRTHGGYFWTFLNDISSIDKLIINKRNRKIMQFDLNNNLLNEFDSIGNASKKLNIKSSIISRSCNGELLKIKNYYFRYEDNVFKLKNKRLTKKPIIKIERNNFGEIENIIEFESLNMASKKLNLSLKGIIGRCKNKYLFDNLEIYYKKDFDNGFRKEERIKGNGEKSIIQVDINGNTINEFKSISEASRKLKFSRSGLCESINKKTYNGYLWVTDYSYISNIKIN